MNDSTLPPINDPAVWTGADMQRDTSWLLHLNSEEVEEIDNALAVVRSRKGAVPFEREAFPLHRVRERLDAVHDILQHGPGFALLRGLPRERYSDEDCALIYWGLAQYLGRPVSQNTRGHLVGHVRDEGRSLSDASARGYQTNARMDFHSDQLPVDILGLLCLRTARKGGASTLVSGLTVHETLRRERPDLLEILYQPLTIDWRGEEPEGEQPWYQVPMFGRVGDVFSSRVTSSQYHESVARYGAELAMTDTQREAIMAVQEIANRPDLRLSMDFRDGDMQFLNNHVILHAREGFEDHPEPHLKRHLLRLWIEAPADRQRPLPAAMEARRRYVRQGGIPVKTGKSTTSVDA